MKKQLIRGAVIEFIGCFVLTIVSSWSIYALKNNKIEYLGFSMINGLLLGVFIWIGILESGSHYNPVITLGI